MLSQLGSGLGEDLVSSPQGSIYGTRNGGALHSPYRVSSKQRKSHSPHILAGCLNPFWSREPCGQPASCKGVDSLLATYAKLSRCSDRIKRFQVFYFRLCLRSCLGRRTYPGITEQASPASFRSGVRLSGQRLKKSRGCGPAPHVAMQLIRTLSKTWTPCTRQASPLCRMGRHSCAKARSCPAGDLVEQIRKSASINLHGADVESVG